MVMSKQRLVEITLLDRLLDIIAEEGLVERVKLEPAATLDEVGLTTDDLILIANKIEREFDRDLLHDEELDCIQTVGGLLDLIVMRIRN
jgi:acyl carrier protein